MKTGMPIQLTTDMLVLFFVLKPLFATSPERKEEIIEAGKELLFFSMKQEASMKFAFCTLVYIVAQVVEIEELINDDIIKNTLYLDDPRFKEQYAAENFEGLRDSLCIDDQIYLDFMESFILETGVLDIEDTLKDLQAIYSRLKEIV